MSMRSELAVSLRVAVTSSFTCFLLSAMRWVHNAVSASRVWPR